MVIAVRCNLKMENKILLCSFWLKGNCPSIYLNVYLIIPFSNVESGQ